MQPPVCLRLENHSVPDGSARLVFDFPMPKRRMVLFDQQKSILPHTCPSALHGVSIGFYCFLYLPAVGRRAQRTDDDFLENEVRSEVDPIESLLVRWIV